MKHVFIALVATGALSVAGCASMGQSRPGPMVANPPQAQNLCADGSCGDPNCAAARAKAAGQSAGKHYYACPMGCTKSATPGPCPKCGMQMTYH